MSVHGVPTGPDVDLEAAAFIHPSALIYGKVRLAQGTSVWPNVVMRAESHHIDIGAFTNIQDFTMVHVGIDTPTVVGAFCSITHRVTLHGCRLGDSVLVGIGATIMDGAEIGAGAIVAPGSVVTEGSKLPGGTVIAGTPAKVVRERDNTMANRINAAAYVRNARAYGTGAHRAWDSPTLIPELAQELAALTADLDAKTP